MTIPTAHRITYAIWSSLGIVLITIIGIFLYKEAPDLPVVISMALIVGGVVFINVFSKTAGH